MSYTGRSYNSSPFYNENSLIDDSVQVGMQFDSNQNQKRYSASFDPSLLLDGAVVTQPIDLSGQLVYGSHGSGNYSRFSEPPRFYFPRRLFLIILGFIGITCCYIIRVLISVTSIPMQKEYNWTNNYKGVLLGAFFMGYIVLQIPASFLCDRFGGKRVFLVGVTLSAILTIIVPWVSHSPSALLALRIITGLSQGIAYPTMNWLMKRWTSVSQRTMSAAAIWSGAYIGTIIVDFSVPKMIEFYSWRVCFFVFGGIAIFWSILWLIFMKDDPSNAWGIHPSEVAIIQSIDEIPATINEESQHLLLNNPKLGINNNYMINNNASDISQKKELQYLNVLKRLFKSTGIYAILFYNLMTSFGFYLLLMWYPTWISKETGLESGTTLAFYTALPYMCAFTISNLSGIISDFLLARGIRKIILRKLFGVLGALIPATLLLVLSFVNMSTGLNITTMVFTIATSGFSASGSNVNTLDLAPDYAGIVMGIGNTIATIPGIVGSVVAGAILSKFGSWIPIFIISSSLYWAAVVCWLIFAKVDKVI